MYTLGIDIGSTTVKVAVLDKDNKILFSDYKRHFANIKETLKDLEQEAKDALGENEVNPCITGSGGLALAQLIGVPFTQEVVCVSEALQDYAPQTDVAIELGGEDAKIIYFTNGIEQRMNGVCAGGTGSFIDQMATLLKISAEEMNKAAEQDVRCSIRPEEFIICKDGTDGIHGTVQECTYLGLNTHYTIDTDQGDSVEIVEESSIGEGLKKGEKVLLKVKKEKINVFTKDGDTNLIRSDAYEKQ